VLDNRGIAVPFLPEEKKFLSSPNTAFIWQVMGAVATDIRHHPARGLRKRWAIPLVPLCAFMA